MVLHLRVDEPGDIAELVREQLRSMDADLPVFDVTTFEDELDASLGATARRPRSQGGSELSR
jgi:hypothetical protein